MPKVDTHKIRKITHNHSKVNLPYCPRRTKNNVTPFVDLYDEIINFHYEFAELSEYCCEVFWVISKTNVAQPRVTIQNIYDAYVSATEKFESLLTRALKRIESQSTEQFTEQNSKQFDIDLSELFDILADPDFAETLRSNCVRSVQSRAFPCSYDWSFYSSRIGQNLLSSESTAKYLSYLDKIENLGNNFCNLYGNNSKSLIISIKYLIFESQIRRIIPSPIPFDFEPKCYPTLLLEYLDGLVQNCERKDFLENKQWNKFLCLNAVMFDCVTSLKNIIMRTGKVCDEKAINPTRKWVEFSAKLYNAYYTHNINFTASKLRQIKQEELQLCKEFKERLFTLRETIEPNTDYKSDQKKILKLEYEMKNALQTVKRLSATIKRGPYEDVYFGGVDEDEIEECTKLLPGWVDTLGKSTSEYTKYKKIFDEKYNTDSNDIGILVELFITECGENQLISYKFDIASVYGKTIVKEYTACDSSLGSLLFKHHKYIECSYSAYGGHKNSDFFYPMYTDTWDLVFSWAQKYQKYVQRLEELISMTQEDNM